MNFTKVQLKLWLQVNDIEMYSKHNEGKSVVAERFMRTLKKHLLTNWLIQLMNRTIYIVELLK